MLGLVYCAVAIAGYILSGVADLGFVLDLDPDTTARLERVAIAIDA